MLVHASFAFVHAVEDGAYLAEPLRTSVHTILECEALVFASQVPACVVRLGYLYGPDSADLRAYRTAFQLLRPYWCGPPKENQYHLHQFDAVTALIGVAKPQNLGKTFYAVDSHPASFARFLDSFAHRTGRARPLHFPLWTRPLAKLMIAEEHMQQTELSMPRLAPGPLVPRWRPQFSGYRDGLKQVINAWDNESV
jgi:nucleoside-diphosphate-sugar epimerase